MKHTVLTLDAAPAGEIDLPESIFGLEPRKDILYRVVQWQMNRRHDGTKKTLTRREIDRTTKKMYKQKGTGGARHGAMSAPQFRGGGKAMAPVIRSRETDLPKRVRALGLKMALSSKVRDGQLIVLDAAKAETPKTKAMAVAFAKLGALSAVIVDGPEFDAGFARASRNLEQVDLLNVAGLNVYDVLRRDKLVLTKAALSAIEERLK
ncbi:MAG TPA: 50S ribosomal protein L4 [Alphaproteobacteria bacterium]|nr:50S ribosomal protein L4 [Alphaproteobacteria bacterium]HAJ45521.1 50S ribosomal protein L4 [Alphaproteobacteria bacterium]